MRSAALGTDVGARPRTDRAPSPTHGFAGERPRSLPQQGITVVGHASRFLNRWYATKITREWNVTHGGVGYVTRFDVRKSFLDRYPVRQAGGRDVLEYWIPAEDLDELNANIVGAIIEEADYRRRVADEEFAEATEALGAPLPVAWRDYLQGRSWFRRGWSSSDFYVWLYTPVDLTGDGWHDALPQAEDISRFIELIESGAFQYTWPD
jgi:hypothetical protein